MLLAGRSLARRLATSSAPVATLPWTGGAPGARLLLGRAAGAAPLSTSPTTGSTGGSNTPVWPPPRSQLARMYEDEEDEFNSHDPERRAAAALRREQERKEAAAHGEEDYLDDHHYVPGGGAGSASLSPHHEGYEEEAGRRQRQRLGLYKRRTASPPQDLKSPAHQGPDHDNDDDGDGPSSGSAGAVGGGGGSPASGAGGGSSGGPGWSWAQPVGERQARGPGGRRLATAVSIPVKPRTLLAAEEVVGALEGLGGQEVQVVDVRGKGNLDAEAMVFASGRSGAHLRRMADTLVMALKQRGINEREAPGVTGAEGYDCDDWMIVDAGNLIVHLMEPRQRKALALEDHWGAADFAGITLPATRSDTAWASAHDQALEAAAHAASDDDYEPFRDDHAAREREFRRLVHGKAGGRVRIRGGRAGRK